MTSERAGGLAAGGPRKGCRHFGLEWRTGGCQSEISDLCALQNPLSILLLRGHAVSAHAGSVKHAETLCIGLREIADLGNQLPQEVQVLDCWVLIHLENGAKMFPSWPRPRKPAKGSFTKPES